MDQRAATPTAATTRNDLAGERFGLFGMGVVQRLALAAIASGLIAIAAWWALA